MYKRQDLHADFTTHVRHGANSCVTRQLTKGAVLNGGTGVFQGKFFVPRTAGQYTDADMQHKALLLEEGAVVFAKPELEIYADDVKCSHGTTTGQLDEDAIYALRTRGIDEATARGLLTLAFAGEVLDKVTLDAIAERVELAVAGKLPERFNLAGLVEAAVALND